MINVTETFWLKGSESIRVHVSQQAGEFEVAWPTMHEARPFFMRLQSIMRLFPTAPLGIRTEIDTEEQAASIWDIPSQPVHVATAEEIGLNASWEETNLGVALATLQGWEQVNTSRLQALLNETGTLAVRAAVPQLFPEIREILGC